LREVVQRERFETFQKNAHLGRVIAMAFGIPREDLMRLEDMLDLAVYQTAYDPEAIQRRLAEARRAAKEFRTERESTAATLARTASYTEPLEAPPPTRFIKRKGVPEPW